MTQTELFLFPVALAFTSNGLCTFRRSCSSCPFTGLLFVLNCLLYVVRSSVCLSEYLFFPTFQPTAHTIHIIIISSHEHATAMPMQPNPSPLPFPIATASASPFGTTRPSGHSHLVWLALSSFASLNTQIVCCSAQHFRSCNCPHPSNYFSCVLLLSSLSLNEEE